MLPIFGRIWTRVAAYIFRSTVICNTVQIFVLSLPSAFKRNEHFHELFWTAKNILWLRIFKSSWCWIIIHIWLCLGYLLAILTVDSSDGSQLFADFCARVSKKEPSEGGSEHREACMALGAEETKSLVSADFVIFTQILYFFPTSFMHLFLLIQILLLPRPLTL